MRYLSVCSGIEAATVAWHNLGWTPVAFSEIEPFPSAVLKHHYPHVPNVGDMTKFKEWNLEPIDLLVGGTPCQSFSVAGLRKGLDDPRGNLMLTFLAIAERERPKWIVWENVPGVLSSNGGRDFGTFLAALGELGYGWAYRVLDAQWFGVAQRRRRVFVVGCLGDQAGAAAVLFESESVCRNPAPSREKGQGSARGVARCFAGSSESRVAATLETTSHDYSRADGFNMVAQPLAGSHWDSPANPHPTLNQSAKGSGGIAASDQELFSQRGSGLVAQPVAIQDVRAVEKAQNGRGWNDDGTAYTVDTYATQGVAVAQPIAIQGTLIGRGDNAGPQGSGVDERGSMFTLTKTDVHAVAQPVAFGGDIARSLTARYDSSPCADRGMDVVAVAQPAAIAFKVRGGVEVDSAGKAAGKGYLGSEETAFTLAATQDQWIGQPVAIALQTDVTPKASEELAFTLKLPSASGGGQPQAVAVGTDCYNGAITGEVAATIGTPGSSVNASGPTVMQPVVYERHDQDARVKEVSVAPTLHSKSDNTCDLPMVQSAMQVRRLTPTECERLQGFPDGWTHIPWRKKDEGPDGPRYKALGNSMAVPVMRWIGRRIDVIETIATQEAANE